MSFQKIVLYVAVVILIIALIFIAISLYSSNSNLYPPVASKCPDYWNASGNDDNVTCNNIKGLGDSGGNCGGPIKPQSDFPETNEVSSFCQKFKWADGCNLTWNGITNSPLINEC